VLASLLLAKAADRRRPTEMCRAVGQSRWLDEDRLVIDCYSRELLGRHLSRSGKPATAGSALEPALISCF